MVPLTHVIDSMATINAVNRDPGTLGVRDVMQEPNRYFPAEDDPKAKISEASTDAGTDIEKSTSEGSSIGCEKKWTSDAAAAACEGSIEKDQPKDGTVCCNEVLKDLGGEVNT